MKDSPAPFSHAWGLVHSARLDTNEAQDVLVRIDEKEYRFSWWTPGIKEMNLLGIPKRHREVLLVFFEGLDGKNAILAGWNNPSGPKVHHIIRCTKESQVQFCVPPRLQLWRECIANRPHWNAPKPR